MGDRYAKLRADLAEEDCSVTGFVAMPREHLVSLLADYDKVREALNWAAAALQAACSMLEPIRERGAITIHGETRTIGVILDSADAALAQEQGE